MLYSIKNCKVDNRFRQRSKKTLWFVSGDLSAGFYKMGLVVAAHGQRLSQHLQPANRAEALKMEKQLILELRRKGYAVWSN